MTDTDRVVSNVLDGYHFEKFKSVDKDTGAVCMIYRVDGIEMLPEEWMRQQEEAIARDLKRLVPIGKAKVTEPNPFGFRRSLPLLYFPQSKRSY